ncbi:MAG: hypothetical protein AAFQ41_14620 [Cyanobacteria bacterium J06623_7]
MAKYSWLVNQCLTISIGIVTTFMVTEYQNWQLYQSDRKANRVKLP